MKPIATDVWQVPGPPFRLPGGVKMPLSSLLVRLPDRSLLLYSPVKLDDKTAVAIDALGEVAHVVAPNRLHHLYVSDALKRWPRAILHAPAGLATKRPDLKIHRELGAGIDPALRDVFDLEIVGGAPKISEALLFHRPSGTLACADFMFNVAEPANLRTSFVLALMGLGGRRLRQSRVWKLAVRDRAAARASIDRVLRWPIARVAPVHGDVAEIDASGIAPLLTRSYGGRVAAALPASS